MSLQKHEERNAVQDAVSAFEKQRPVNPSEVLAELFELLEEYAPLWYTEEHHNRIEIALRIRRRA